MKGRAQRFLICPAVAVAAGGSGGGAMAPNNKEEDGGWHILQQISLFFRPRRRHAF